MEYRQLGSSELEVPAVIFGAWAAGGWFWGPQDDEQSIRAIRAGVEHGITCIDTAPMYGMGHSEEVVGRAIKGIRDKVTVATKCGLRWDTPGEGTEYFTCEMPDGSKHPVRRNLVGAAIIDEVEMSLKRLGVDVIDLYQCHWPDECTPVPETMEAMMKLKKQGKIRVIGVSNFTTGMLGECLACADLASDQPKYSLLGRDVEKDVLPFCHKNNIGVICYSPMEQGLLTGRVTMDRTFPESDYRTHNAWFKPNNRQRVLDALAKVQPIADGHGATLAQVSIAWIIAQPGVTSAIVGARNAAQVADNAKAADVRLSSGEVAQIRKIFEDLGSPEA